MVLILELLLMLLMIANATVITDTTARIVTSPSTAKSVTKFTAARIAAPLNLAKPTINVTTVRYMTTAAPVINV